MNGLLVADGEGVGGSSSYEDEVSSGHVVPQDIVNGLLDAAEETLDVAARKVVLVGDGVCQPGSDVIGIDLSHWVFHPRRVAEGDDGHVGVERKVVADKLLSGLVDPLPLAVIVHGGGGLQDQDVLLSGISYYSDLWFQLWLLFLDSSLLVGGSFGLARVPVKEK